MDERAETGAPDLAVVLDAERLAALRATGLLDAPPTEAFDRITRMAADLLGIPVVIVSLVDADRQFFLSCVGISAPWSDARETPLSHSFCQYVVASDDELLISDARTVPWLRESRAIAELGVIAYAGFPLYAGGGRPIGSFCAIDGEPREWSEREVGQLREFAAIVQSELDLRTARDEARRGSVLLTRLQALTDAAGEAGELDDLLERLVAACAETFAADFVAIDMVDGHGRLLQRTQRGLPPARAATPFQLGAGFAGRIGALEQAISVRDVRDVEQASSGLRESGARGLLAAPLIVDARVEGAVYVGAAEPGAFGETDRRLLALACDRFAPAVVRARDQQRDRLVVQTLVAALQPARVPVVEGVRLAARYLPAERGLGGDWYDAFRLPGGSLGVAIGDVVGHGIGAAAEAVRLRTALRGAVLEDRAPAAAVAALNRHAEMHPGAFASTVVYMELDPVARHARWASAGHLPGVIACAGEGAWLGLADGPPLGVTSRRTWPGAERELAPGTRIVLFTDGLVESRVAPIDEGIDRIVAAAATATSLEGLCEAALAQAPAPRIDDLALIALELA